MNEYSSGQDIASTMGNLLRSLSDAGYEVRRVAAPETTLRPENRFEELIDDDQLREVSGPLFRDSHYARAVEEAFKCLNNAVKTKSGLTEGDGAGLMRSAFSVNAPILFLNSFQTQSERDEQQGYMEIYAGSMTGIRNPRAHQHDLLDEEHIAIELLVLANHLMRKLERARKQEQT